MKVTGLTAMVITELLDGIDMIHPNPDVRLISDFLDEFEDHDDKVLAVYEALTYMKDFECNSIEQALNAARESMKD